MRKLCMAFSMLIGSTTLVSHPASSQIISTEERFQDLFVTAGYGTAFGAAFGAALLSFQPKPEDNLRYVAVGASVGFIAGSLLGSYVIFSPVFTASQESKPSDLSRYQRAPIILRPTFNTREAYKLSQIEGQLTLLRF